MAKVVFIDAYNILYRAYHATKDDPRIVEDNGQKIATAALYRAIAMVQKLKEPDITYSLVVFDGEENFREKIDENYKAHREPMPEELKPQLELFKKGLELLGWPIYESVDVEADDVIASMALRAAAANFEVKIYSSDKDFRAIVNDNIVVIDSMHKVNYDKAMVFEKMGVYPEQVRLYLTLMGDGADNVKGVQKCGAKTAASWANSYLTIENLISNAPNMKDSVAVRNLNSAISSGSLLKDYELIGLKTDLDIKLSKSYLSFKPIDENKLKEFSKKYKLFYILNELENSSFVGNQAQNNKIKV